MLGDILDGFMGRKLKQISYSDKLKNELEGSTDRSKAAADANDLDVANYSTALKGARAKDAAMQAGDVSLFDRVAKRLADTGGLDTYQRIGDINSGLATKATANLASLGQAQDNLMQSRLGYGGRGPSTYTQITNNDRAGRNAAPVWAQVISSITPGVNAVMGNDRAQAGALADTIAEKSSVPYRGLDTIIDPSRARTANIYDYLAQLGLIGDGIKKNTAGFKEEKNKVAAGFQAMDQGIEDLVGMASSAAGGLFGGGAGGILGGMFGGGGKQPARRAGTGGGYEALMNILNTA